MATKLLDFRWTGALTYLRTSFPFHSKSKGMYAQSGHCIKHVGFPKMRKIIVFKLIIKLRKASHRFIAADRISYRRIT